MFFESIFFYLYADSHTLQDGLYNVRGHVVEIKNGTRVPSADIHSKGIPMRSNSGTHDRKANDSPANYDYRTKNSIYSGKESLLRHLSGLAHQTVGLKAEDEKEKESVPQVENGLISQQDPYSENTNRQWYGSRQTSLASPAIESHQNDDKNGKDISPIIMSPSDGSLSSADSLEVADANHSRSVTRTPKSSLKRQNVRESSNKTKRKVKFNNSIEFNDGFIWMLKDNEQKSLQLPTPSTASTPVVEEKSSLFPVEEKPCFGSGNQFTARTSHANPSARGEDYSYPESVDLALPRQSSVDQSERKWTSVQGNTEKGPEEKSTNQVGRANLHDSLELYGSKGDSNSNHDNGNENILRDSLEDEDEEEKGYFSSDKKKQNTIIERVTNGPAESNRNLLNGEGEVESNPIGLAQEGRAHMRKNDHHHGEHGGKAVISWRHNEIHSGHYEGARVNPHKAEVYPQAVAKDSMPRNGLNHLVNETDDWRLMNKDHEDLQSKHPHAKSQQNIFAAEDFARSRLDHFYSKPSYTFGHSAYLLEGTTTNDEINNNPRDARQTSQKTTFGNAQSPGSTGFSHTAGAQPIYVPPHQDPVAKHQSYFIMNGAPTYNETKVSSYNSPHPTVSLHKQTPVDVYPHGSNSTSAYPVSSYTSTSTNHPGTVHAASAYSVPDYRKMNQPSTENTTNALKGDITTTYNDKTAINFEMALGAQNGKNIDKTEDDEEDEVISNVRKSLAELQFSSNWRPGALSTNNQEEKASPSEQGFDKNFRPSNKVKGLEPDVVDNGDEIKQQSKIEETFKGKSGIPVRVASAKKSESSWQGVSGRAQQKAGIVPHPPSSAKGLFSRRHSRQESAKSRHSPMRVVNPNRDENQLKTFATGNANPVKESNGKANGSSNSERSSKGTVVQRRQPEGMCKEGITQLDSEQRNWSEQSPDGKLNKTPTDDEINELWYNVRHCLSAKPPHKASSDSVYVVPTWKQSRTWSGSRRGRTNSQQQSNLHTMPANRHTPGLPLRRYGSHENLSRRENSFDNFIGHPKSRVQSALLPQRSNKERISTNFNAFSAKKQTNNEPVQSKRAPNVSTIKANDSKYCETFIVFG